MGVHKKDNVDLIKYADNVYTNDKKLLISRVTDLYLFLKTVDSDKVYKYGEHILDNRVYKDTEKEMSIMYKYFCNVCKNKYDKNTYDDTFCKIAAILQLGVIDDNVAKEILNEKDNKVVYALLNYIDAYATAA